MPAPTVEAFLALFLLRVLMSTFDRTYERSQAGGGGQRGAQVPRIFAPRNPATTAVDRTAVATLKWAHVFAP